VLPALIASALVVLGAPYVGQARGALQSAFPEHYRSIVGGSVALALAAALVSAVARIRRQPDRSAAAASQPVRVRYALIAAAVIVGGVYAHTVSSGNIDQDLVELFHFVEYGGVAYLYYRIWQRRPDAAAIAFPACAALSVGVADEWVQWFVPGRIGELRDIWLNAAAVLCGLLISVAMHPPRSLAWPRHGGARVAIGAAVSALVVAVGVFVDRVHLGYEIHDNGAPVFRSRHDAMALAASSAERAIRWRDSPPALEGFAREDQYHSEGLWHIQRRNIAVGDGDVWVAWNENLILERFYAPVLDRGSRWSSEEASRMGQEAERTPPTAQYVSDAEPYPLYVINRATFRLSTAVLAGAILWLCRRRGPSGRARTP